MPIARVNVSADPAFPSSVAGLAWAAWALCALSAACSSPKGGNQIDRDSAASIQQPSRAPAPPSTSTPAATSPSPAPPPPTANRRCAATMLNVIVRRPGATNDSTLRAIAEEILSADRGLVTGIDVSPAIRTFRVHLVDTASVDRVTKHIRAAAGVEDVSPDDCSMRIQRPTAPPASSR